MIKPAVSFVIVICGFFLLYDLNIGPSLANAENLNVLSIFNPSKTSSDKTLKADGPSDEEQITSGEVSRMAASAELKNTGIFWQKPNYDDQDGFLGWTEDVFRTAPGLERRIKFWEEIYAKYSTQQVLLHDSRYFDIIYKVVDFKDIESDAKLDNYQKHRARRRRVKNFKRQIRAMLKRIHRLQDTPGRLTPREFEIFRQFRFIDEKNKFLKAAGRNRLRMQLGQKDRFRLGIYYSGRYIREMERIFREEKVPVELTRLPFVESSFNIHAYSKVGASGIWQFMRSTGRLFKLRVDSVRDLRNDPLKATVAASRMLAGNYRMLENWPMAITGYNHGPAGVARVARNLKTKDINTIVWNAKSRRFGFASQNFYAEFVAAVRVEAEAKRHFGNVEVAGPLLYDEVKLPRAIRFGEFAAALSHVSLKPSADPTDLARMYNPFFSRPVRANWRAIPRGFEVRVPLGTKEKFLAKLEDGTIKFRVAAARAGTYRILPGDTLTGISRDFGVPLRRLMRMNRLRMKSVLRPGQRLRIPGWTEK